MIEQLKKILIIVENEIFDENSLWDKDQLIKVIKPEMEELYDYFKSNIQIDILIKLCYNRLKNMQFK